MNECMLQREVERRWAIVLAGVIYKAIWNADAAEGGEERWRKGEGYGLQSFLFFFVWKWLGLLDPVSTLQKVAKGEGEGSTEFPFFYV